MGNILFRSIWHSKSNLLLAMFTQTVDLGTSATFASLLVNSWQSTPKWEFLATFANWYLKHGTEIDYGKSAVLLSERTRCSRTRQRSPQVPPPGKLEEKYTSGTSGYIMVPRWCSSVHMCLLTSNNWVKWKITWNRCQSASSLKKIKLTYCGHMLTSERNSLYNTIQYLFNRINNKTKLKTFAVNHCSTLFEKEAIIIIQAVCNNRTKAGISSHAMF